MSKIEAMRILQKKAGKHRGSVSLVGAPDYFVLTRAVSVMYNDLANAMDSANMMGSYGPAGWDREMFAMGVANAHTAALSTLPPYGASRAPACLMRLS